MLVGHCTPQVGMPLVVRSLMGNYATPPPVIPVGFELRMRVEQLPPSSSPFHSDEKRELRTMTGSDIMESMDKNVNTKYSPKKPEEIAIFILTGGFMAFFYWFTNFAIPNYVFKDTVFKKKDPDDTADEEDPARLEMERTGIGAIVYKEESLTKKKKAKKFKKKRTTATAARK